MIVMNNLESLATEIGKDIKGIKEQQVTKDELDAKHYLTENQTLSLEGNRLSLTNGGSVNLPTVLRSSEYRISKSDIAGNEVGATATIPINSLMNPIGIKLGDVIQSFNNNSEGADEGYWIVTGISAQGISVRKIGSRHLYSTYNDTELKQKISALESRPSFDTLTPTQRDSLRGENGHSLNATVRIEGSYRNGSTSQLNLFADVFYDGEKLTSGYTLDYYYRGFGNNNWGVLRNQTPDSTGKFSTWSATQRSGGWFEVRIEVNYRGLKTSAFTRLDNVNDGERGPQGVQGQRGPQGNVGPAGARGATGERGPAGAPGQNIVNQNGGQPIRYWAGTQAQYDAIASKDSNTIYDIFK